jgi:hypothetical protein
MEHSVCAEPSPKQQVAGSSPARGTNVAGQGPGDARGGDATDEGPRSADGGSVCVRHVQPRVASQAQAAVALTAPRGSEAAAPSSASRAIELLACPRSWRPFGPRRLRQQSKPARTVMPKDAVLCLIRQRATLATSSATTHSPTRVLVALPPSGGSACHLPLLARSVT